MIVIEEKTIERNEEGKIGAGGSIRRQSTEK